MITQKELLEIQRIALVFRLEVPIEALQRLPEEILRRMHKNMPYPDFCRIVERLLDEERQIKLFTPAQKAKQEQKAQIIEPKIRRKRLWKRTKSRLIRRIRCLILTR